MKQFFLTSIIAAMLLGGCAGSPLYDSTGQSERFVQADVRRVSAAELANAQVDPLVQGLNGFAIDFYQQVKEQNTGNWMFSPYSISMAFSMVYPGARGQTESQMADVMHFLPQEAHHPAFNALDQRLAELAAEEPAEEAFRLNIANAVWGQQGFTFQTDFLETLARHYGAGLQTVDFIRDPGQARRIINDWVAEKTEDRIQNAVQDDFITDMTRLVLANAIYFKGAWVYPFDPSATRDGPFSLTDGTQVAVPLMHAGTGRFPYMEGDGFQAALLPYEGAKADMIVILPAPGRFEEIEQGLSVDLFNKIRLESEEQGVALTMPKLDFETELDLGELLAGMGMVDAFIRESAEFSGIGDGLFISQALHKSTITVDEEGTEAAAATVIAIEVTGEFPRTALVMDRPFIFAIQERGSGAILFLGRVMNPVH